MPQDLTSLRMLAGLPFDTIIDVRSPAEYAEDHVPGAMNLPALSNAERAIVGTIYKQEDPFKARKTGAAMVARNAAQHLEGPLAPMPGAGGPWSIVGAAASVLAPLPRFCSKLAGVPMLSGAVIRPIAAWLCRRFIISLSPSPLC